VENLQQQNLDLPDQTSNMDSAQQDLEDSGTSKTTPFAIEANTNSLVCQDQEAEEDQNLAHELDVAQPMMTQHVSEAQSVEPCMSVTPLADSSAVELMPNTALVMFQKLCSMIQVKLIPAIQGEKSFVSHISVSIPNLGEMILSLLKSACDGHHPPKQIKDWSPVAFPVKTINNQIITKTYFPRFPKRKTAKTSIDNNQPIFGSVEEEYVPSRRLIVRYLE
jgi:hypothetical protein